MRYKVIRSCYWNHRLWEKGEEVEVAGDVPEHFQPLTSTAARLAALKAEVDALRVPAQKEAAPAEEFMQEETACVQAEEPMQEETAPAEAPTQEDADEQATSLESMNVGQLQKLARENGLEPPKNATKKELISALRGE
ncbi:Rho termination factor N-terminal domain-containing protein [Phascolarctobacterium succinatutens]|uniref:Rho termination factor N-terminal domain-containing protein n=1 Tax=Phascolarctobacterium succinatutens TaxID=626940 RepID=UPI0026E9BB62|nr:Rho termination factor N-terminal domain-containing protein [Phascolarctobacterium succinatutens]